jgi:hypothetical protein
MNPLAPDSMMNKSFFGKNLIESFSASKKKPWNYGRMKAKQIARRRKRNKAAAKARRVNRIRQELNKGTKRQPKKNG